MALTQQAPNTIHLSGPITYENRWTAGEAITPGHLIELYSDSGVPKWRKHATSTEIVTHAVALEDGMNNRGIDTDYAAGDLVQAGFLCCGSVWNALIASGQNIAKCDPIQSAGGGTLKSATDTTAAANVAHFQSLDGPGAVTVLTRIKTQVIC